MPYLRAKEVALNTENPVHRILAELSPAALRIRILNLADQRPVGSRSDVPLVTLMDALTKGADLGTGAEGWEAQLQLKRAIKAMVAQIEGMRFIEGDS
jgi:hypothetical protein